MKLKQFPKYSFASKKKVKSIEPILKINQTFIKKILNAFQKFALVNTALKKPHFELKKINIKHTSTETF